MTFDPVSYSEIKKLVKPIVKSSAPPSSTDVIWYDETDGYYKIYSPKFNRWVLLVNFGNDNFDNNGGWYWTNYIEIPIQTTPTEDIQYLIEIDGTTVSVYSNDLTTTLVSSTINNFWNNVQTNGYDIRVFDETFEQNYFWIEEFDYTNQKCKILVKINAGQELLGITFGNPYAENSLFNDGKNTFEFFDDFNGTSLDTKWKIISYYGTITVSDSILKFTQDSGTEGGLIGSNINGYTTNFIFHTKVNFIPAGYGRGVAVSDSNTYPGSNCVIVHCDTTGSANPKIGKSENGTSTSIYNFSTLQNNVWHIYTITCSNSTLNVFVDYNKVASNTFNPSNSLTYALIGNNATVPSSGDWTDIYVDYIIVSKTISDIQFGTPTLKSF